MRRRTTLVFLSSRPFLLPLLALAGFCLWRGVTQPLAEFTQLFFFTRMPSLLQVVQSLWESDDWLLAVVVGLFSVALPTLKIAVLLLVVIGVPAGKVVKGFSALSRWSMLDVLLVALVIFSAKTSGLASAVTQPGVWWFLGAVVLSAIASELMKRRKYGHY